MYLSNLYTSLAEKRNICSPAVFLLLLGLWAAPAMAQEHPKWPPESYAVYYGEWNEKTVSQARGFDLLIVHPGEDLENLDRELVKKLQHGADGQPGTDDDAVVCAYVSIGETSDSPGGPPTAAELKQKGPVYQQANRQLAFAGQAYPTRFLDELAYALDETGFFKIGPNGKKMVKPGQDGLPDMNGIWGSYFIYPGDQSWRREVQDRMTTLKDELGVDGFFLDTVDTASKWGHYGYAQKEMAEFVALLRKEFPRHFLIGNRGISLLESHPDLYRSSIDALMFEGFATDWDWTRKKGRQSPWLGSHHWVLENVVGPQAKREDGFLILVLDYLNLHQPELSPLLHAQRELCDGYPHLFYLSHPSLDRFYPPPGHYFPEGDSESNLPKISKFEAESLDEGRFRLELTTDSALPSSAQVDLRYRPQGDTTSRIQGLKSWPQSWQPPRRENGRWLLEGQGLKTGTEYTFYARLVGPTRRLSGDYQEAKLVVPPHPFPAPQEIRAESREQGVEVSWKGEEGRRYQVYLDGEPAGIFARPPALVTGLNNGQSYLVSVATLDPDGRSGPSSMPISCHAQDSTPPSVPTGLEAGSEGEGLRLRWQAVAEATRYYLYFRRGQGLWRLPLQSTETTLVVPEPAPGSYQIVVTSLDGDGNESAPSSPVSWDRARELSEEVPREGDRGSAVWGLGSR